MAILGNLLGRIIGVYILYAIFALIFKHKVGFIISCVLCFVTSIASMIYGNDTVSLSTDTIGLVIIYFFEKIQIRNKK